MDPPRRACLSPVASSIKDTVLAAVIGFLLPVLFGCNDSSAGQGTGGKGILAPCPSSPNCVSSRDPDPARRVEPILFTGDPASEWSRLRKVIAEEGNPHCRGRVGVPSRGVPLGVVRLRGRRGVPDGRSRRKDRRPIRGADGVFRLRRKPPASRGDTGTVLPGTVINRRGLHSCWRERVLVNPIKNERRDP